MKNAGSTFAIAALLLALGATAASQVSPKHEFRGVWLTTVGATDWPPARPPRGG